MGDYNVEIPSAEDQLQAIIEDPDLPTEIREQAKMELQILQMTPEQLARKARANVPAVSLDVTVYKQEEKYYCGPATTKQTMKFLTGSADSQSTIAKALGTTTEGTDGLRIVSYLNSKQSKVRYTVQTNPSVDQLKSWQQSGFNRIYMGGNMYTNLKPHIARVKLAQGQDWAYSTNGHFFNVTGYSANQAKTRISDPNIQRVQPSSTGHYLVTYTALYNATKNHFAKHYYS